MTNVNTVSFRAFYFKRWDYWGSNGDAGSGAWSIEIGSTQGWIVSVFDLRQLKPSFCPRFSAGAAGLGRVP